MEHPDLFWVPGPLHVRKPKALRKTVVTPTYATAEGILAAERTSHSSRRDVLLITRVEPATWVGFRYINENLLTTGPVAFSRVQLSGLPLGGDPLIPQTYLVDSGQRLGAIFFDGAQYAWKRIDAPISEGSPPPPWINAIVPIPLQNDGPSLRWTPRFHLLPGLDELTTVMTWAATHLPPDTKIKASGSRHAWSAVAVTSSLHIAPDNLRSLKLLSDDALVYRQDLDPDRRARLVRGGSGNTVRETNRFLWTNGLAFPALGGYDGQTLGGVFTTGTHGSVFSRSHLAETIISIDLVCADGTLVRIEPEAGITDPDAFRRAFPMGRLVQADETFRAALINMGTMGVVHSVVLEVARRFHMKEVRTKISVPELKSRLAEGKIALVARTQSAIPAELANTAPQIAKGGSEDAGFKDHPLSAYHFELLFNPHGDKVVITSRHPLAVSEADDKDFDFQPPGRDLVRTILRNARFSRPAFPTWFQENFKDILVWGIDTLSHLFPCLVPRLIDGSMDTLIDDAYVDRSFNVFHVGMGTNSIPALSSTIFVPVEEDKYLKALDIVLQTAKTFAGRGKYETAPVSMRFVKQSIALLGLPKDSCAFEFIFTASTKHAQEMIEGYDAALRSQFGDDVRVHWGQMMRDPTLQQVRGMYPGYDRWRAIRDEFDPERRFLNEWQERILADN